MKTFYLRLGVVGILALTVAAILQQKPSASLNHDPLMPTLSSSEVGTRMPVLLELGSVTCVPCRMMAPILDEVQKEYADKLRVSFVDVKADREAARRYRVEAIPTQIVFAADGREVFRHTGYISKDDLVRQLKELGIGL